jgi:hypothetical protein
MVSRPMVRMALSLSCFRDPFAPQPRGRTGVNASDLVDCREA